MNLKNPATRIKKLYILALIAMGVVILLNIIAWAPTLESWNELNEDWSEHKSDEHAHVGLFYDYEENCRNCESYSNYVDNYVSASASLWANVLGTCALIGLAGAACYALGSMLELKQAAAPQQPPVAPQEPYGYPPAQQGYQPPVQPGYEYAQPQGYPPAQQDPNPPAGV